MELIILVDNAPHPFDSTLSSEHGLSILIKRDNGEIVLCDTGKGDTYRHNMENLGLNITDVSRGFLSHAHNDHSGGLEDFLSSNTLAQVYLSEKAIGRGFFSTRHEAGIKDLSMNPSIAKKWSNRLIYMHSSAWIDDDTAIVFNSCRKFSTPSGNRYLKTGSVSENTNDDFCHEMSLALRTDDGLVVISSYSHNGAANIISSCREFTGLQNIKAFIGGLHLTEGPDMEKDVESFIAEIREIAPETRIITGHCTCEGAKKILQGSGLNISFFHTGSRLTI